jgi:hypothetical protein
MAKYIILLLTMLTMASCSTSTPYAAREYKKSINRARRALDKKIYSLQYQYVIVNNQIIMFENIN